YSSLALGPHTFAVRATDAAGNPDPSPAEASWTIVTTNGGTFLAEADTYVVENRATKNFGSTTQLIADGGSGIRHEALLKFSVSGATGAVTSAKLRLWITNGTGNGPEVFLTEAGWAETVVTWNTRPAITSGVIADTGAIPQGAWYEIDVTSAITGDGTYAFVLSSISTDALKFASRETTTRPELAIVWDS
ncbi:MAG TPA: DNRLRE domain-containing protein, partial [Candidatus Limnocylindria bacterium]